MLEITLFLIGERVFTTQEYCTLNISVNYNKSVNVGKPYIHYIAVKIMNNVSRKSLD